MTTGTGVTLERIKAFVSEVFDRTGDGVIDTKTGSFVNKLID